MQELLLKDFIYHISHDLRAPVRHIKSFFSLLISDLNGKLSEDQEELVQYIDTSIQTLSSQLEGLLKLSRINSDDMLAEKFDVKDKVIDTINKKFKTANIKTQWLIHGNTSIISYLPLINIALEEIINNAAKFVSPGNSPELKITIAASENNVDIAFTDSGIGITCENASEVFSPFRRYVLAKEYEGIGLGLTLAQAALLRCGSSLEWKNNDGNGTTFSLSLPKIINNHTKEKCDREHLEQPDE